MRISDWSSDVLFRSTAATATGPALAAAAETARIARIGYREGKFGQLDLLDAERTLAETRLAAIDALLSYHLAQAQLERLTMRRSEENTSELQSLMRISYAVCCLKKKEPNKQQNN